MTISLFLYSKVRINNSVQYFTYTLYTFHHSEISFFGATDHVSRFRLGERSSNPVSSWEMDSSVSIKIILTDTITASFYNTVKLAFINARMLKKDIKSGISDFTPYFNQITDFFVRLIFPNSTCQELSISVGEVTKFVKNKEKIEISNSWFINKHITLM